MNIPVLTPNDFLPQGAQDVASGALARNLLKTSLENQHQKLINQYYPSRTMADILNTLSTAGLTSAQIGGAQAESLKKGIIANLFAKNLGNPNGNPNSNPNPNQDPNSSPNQNPQDMTAGDNLTMSPQDIQRLKQKFSNGNNDNSNNGSDYTGMAAGKSQLYDKVTKANQISSQNPFVTKTLSTEGVGYDQPTQLTMLDSTYPGAKAEGDYSNQVLAGAQNTERHAATSLSLVQKQIEQLKHTTDAVFLPKLRQKSAEYNSAYQTLHNLSTNAAQEFNQTNDLPAGAYTNYEQKVNASAAASPDQQRGAYARSLYDMENLLKKKILTSQELQKYYYQNKGTVNGFPYQRIQAQSGPNLQRLADWEQNDKTSFNSVFPSLGIGDRLSYNSYKKSNQNNNTPSGKIALVDKNNNKYLVDSDKVNSAIKKYPDLRRA